jgi:hypothetical protein
MAFITFLLFPILVISTNQKLKASLKKELKEWIRTWNPPLPGAPVQPIEVLN